MSLDQAFNALNRDISRPNYSQLPIAYGKRHTSEHTVDSDFSFIDTYPVVLVVDSQDRNTNLEEPGFYTVHLNETLKNITSIELVSGKLPNPSYNVTKNNNCLYFQETVEQMEENSCYGVIVEPGEYRPATLAETLTRLMCEVGGSKYSVTFDPITKRVTISTDDKVGTGIFNLIFTDKSAYMADHGFIDQTFIGRDSHGSSIKFDVKNVQVGCKKSIYNKRNIGKILGFKPINMTGQLSYTGTYTCDLSPFSYMAIFINDYDRVHSVNKSIDKSFCVIPLDCATNTFDVNARNVDNVKHIRFFNPPLKELNKVVVKFVDAHGNIVDFMGHNNLLILEVACSAGKPILRNTRQLVAGGH